MSPPKTLSTSPLRRQDKSSPYAPAAKDTVHNPVLRAGHEAFT